MKKQMKRNHGITLIALVVTIIVLLILAAISIGVLTGDNGIIKQSQQAKEATEIAEEKEILNISVAQATEEDIYGNLEEEPFREKLNDNAEGTELEKIGDNYKVTFPSDREYIVTGNGDINPIDYANTVELVAKLAYIDGQYVIGVGFEDHQLVSDFIEFIIEKTKEEKEKIFINYINIVEETKFDNLEDIFTYCYKKGYIESEVTTLEELIEEALGYNIENNIYNLNIIDFFLTKQLLQLLMNGYNIEEFIEGYGISGTLIAPDGKQFQLSTNNIEFGFGEVFESYCYPYMINKNGEYTFIFIGDDGSYGETTLKIDNETPQIVTEYRLDTANMAIMLGIDNFVDMEEASLELFLPSNKTINLTPYISSNINGFPDAVKGIAIFSAFSEIGHHIFEGEFTCQYNGIELKRKISIENPL